MSRERRTVVAVMAGSLAVLAALSACGSALLYRHFDANISSVDANGTLTNRPDKEVPEAINVLVMGSDDRDCRGCAVDQHTGEAKSSDTTILIHLSADRTRAYGVSIPRDSVVDRPRCTRRDGTKVPAARDVMWNEAFAVGQQFCTMQQFEQLSGIRLDHYVVVDFGSFRSMVDALGGVEVCIPRDIEDQKYGIYLPAGTRRLDGRESELYIRERHFLSYGSDLGRVRRQQAFVASMIHQVVSTGTLSHPDRLLRFLEAATGSLTVDPGLEHISDLVGLGSQLEDIGLDHIQFVTLPTHEDADEFGRVLWTQPQADRIFAALAQDEPLPRSATSTAIKAGSLPGSGQPLTLEQKADREFAGLCA